MKDTTTLVRELAKSNKYQTIYSNEKPVGLRLFKNDIDYSELQITFLNYLAFYYSIAMDVAMGDVDKRVHDNFIYEDAYTVYRSSKRKDDMKDNIDKKKEMIIKKN
jgi:hypothetical protein